jgi:ATP-dependent DNA ligase
VPIGYDFFDVMVLGGCDLTPRPLTVRREFLHRYVLPNLCEPIRHSSPLDASLADLIRSVREHGLEGLVAKRLDSL